MGFYRDIGPKVKVHKGPEGSVWGHSGQTHLEVSALWLQPVIDKALRISGKAQHELSLGLELVNGLNGFMNLRKIKQRKTVSLK